ncbi:hypothetical protein F4680DRAFT_470861 [Xylaria scruposa]|nr:hypothetical protein F4680DRAFT_470861 [Xylaria scruposa]
MPTEHFIKDVMLRHDEISAAAWEMSCGSVGRQHAASGSTGYSAGWIRDRATGRLNLWTDEARLLACATSRPDNLPTNDLALGFILSWHLITFTTGEPIPDYGMVCGRSLPQVSVRIWFRPHCKKLKSAWLAATKAQLQSVRTWRSGELFAAMYGTGRDEQYRSIVIPKIGDSLYLELSQLIKQEIVTTQITQGGFQAVWPDWTTTWTWDIWNGDKTEANAIAMMQFNASRSAKQLHASSIFPGVQANTPQAPRANTKANPVYEVPSGAQASTSQPAKVDQPAKVEEFYRPKVSPGGQAGTSQPAKVDQPAKVEEFYRPNISQPAKVDQPAKVEQFRGSLTLLNSRLDKPPFAQAGTSVPRAPKDQQQPLAEKSRPAFSAHSDKAPPQRGFKHISLIRLQEQRGSVNTQLIDVDDVLSGLDIELGTGLSQAIQMLEQRHALVANQIRLEMSRDTTDAWIFEALVG